MAALDSLSGTFQAEIGGITAVDNWVEQIGQRLKIDEKVAFRARLCIAEIAANVLERGAKAADFTITLQPRGSDLDIEFADSGTSSDPIAAADIRLPPCLNPLELEGPGCIWCER